MSAEQSELDFDQVREERREERLAELLALLLAHGGWITRKELELQGFNERELRALSEHDRDGTIFSYPNSPGYKHFNLVTEDEFDRCVALKSQAKRMVQKWIRFQRRWHRRFKANGGASSNE